VTYMIKNSLEEKIMARVEETFKQMEERISLLESQINRLETRFKRMLVSIHILMGTHGALSLHVYIATCTLRGEHHADTPLAYL